LGRGDVAALIAGKASQPAPEHSDRQLHL